MAQLLIDALTGSVLDAQTVLAVQQLFEANQGVGNDRVGEAEVPQDDQGSEEEDTFQCGKCKRKFTSLPNFFAHKKESCTGHASTTLCDPAVSAAALDRLSASQLTAFQQAALVSNSRVTMSEADLLSLSSPLEGPLDLQSTATSESSVVLAQTPGLAQDAAIIVSQRGLLNASRPSSTLPGLADSVIAPVLSLTPAQPDTSSSAAKMESARTLLTASELLEKEVEYVVADGGHATAGADISENFEPSQGMKACDTTTSKNHRRSSNVSDSSHHKKTKNQSCPYCNKGFSKNFDLQQHIRSHTGEKPFQCVICGRAFAQKSNVKKHMQTHKVWPNGLSHTLPPQVVISSSNSGKTSDDSPDSDTKEETYQSKSKEVVLNNSYVCPYCSFVGMSYCQLKSHMKQHRQEKVFKCIVGKCGQMFGDLESFLTHARTHENDMMYRCQLCPKTLPSLYDLSVHQFTHTLYLSSTGVSSTARVHRCSGCLNKYATAEALAHHEATCSHNYPCPVCQKVFPCERYLRRHLVIHRAAAPYECTICKKAFKTENYLKVHSVIHTDEKPFLCSQCGATFNRQDKLKRHSLVHEAVKRFKCPFAAHLGCRMEFSRADKLKAHLLTHSGVKPYQCKTCGRGFAQRSRLKNHELLHAGVPFQCNNCEHKFLSQKALDEHSCRKRPAYNWRGRGKRRPAARSATCGQTRTSRSRSEVATVPDKDLESIPTAHIEIISTTGDLGSSDVSLTFRPVDDTIEKSLVDQQLTVNLGTSTVIGMVDGSSDI